MGSFRPTFVTMTLFYLSIPLMLLGMAIALLPLLWVMARDRRSYAVTPIRAVSDPTPPRSAR